jgi:O-antigen/teichoic acid export membrane protein
LNFNGSFPQIKQFLFNLTAWKTYSLFISEIANAGLLFLSTILLTRWLGSEDFGVFSFYLRFTTFLQLFYRLGLFYGASLILPHEKDTQRSREIIGASLLIGWAVGIAFSLSIYIFSFFVDSLFHVNVANVFRWITPALLFFPMQALIRQVDRGLGQVSNIILINILPQISFLIFILLGQYANSLSVDYTIIINAATVALTCLLVAIRLKPSFANLHQSIKQMMVKSKSYGIYAYFVELTDQAATSLNSILIPWFASTTELGFFTLAQGLVLPITKMSYSIGMVMFKRLATSLVIPRRILVVNFSWLGLSCAAVLLLSDFLVTFLFGSEYLSVIPLVLPSVLMAFFVGAYQIYTFYLTAHEKRFVSFLSLALFPLNVIGNYWLIENYQVQGAMTFQWIRGLVWFVLILVYYKWLVKTNRTQPVGIYQVGDIDS